jgi:hypothetical protein
MFLPLRRRRRRRGIGGRISPLLMLYFAPRHLTSPDNAAMAFVVRIDTWERIGYFAGLKGPLARGASGCMFDAWRHPDGLGPN